MARTISDTFMIRIHPLLLILALILALPAMGQEHFCVMELNAENLFTPTDNPLTDDDDFTPQSARRWTWSKFTGKIRNLGKEIAAAGGMVPPDIVALCEVEDDSAMVRLTKTGPLRRAHYNYFITKGLDKRGINCALLYNEDTYKPFFRRDIRPDFTGLPAKTTRDILYVAGRIATGDTLDIMVCHLPSRLDPRKQGRPYRERIAAMLRAFADSLSATRMHYNLIITGDFNDPPESAALDRVLRAAPPDTVAPQSAGLYNLMRHKDVMRGVNGTYCYKGKWEIIDNFIVSGRLLSPDAPLNIRPASCFIFAPSFLLHKAEGAIVPYRSYSGIDYIGGFSDHLPVVARFDYSW